MLPLCSRRACRAAAERDPARSAGRCARRSGAARGRCRRRSERRRPRLDGDLALGAEERLEHEPQRLREPGARPVELRPTICPQAQLGAGAARRPPAQEARTRRSAPTSTIAIPTVGSDPVPGRSKPGGRSGRPRPRARARRATPKSSPGTSPSTTQREREEDDRAAHRPRSLTGGGDRPAPSAARAARARRP